jgi:hypothetical protein
MPTRTRDEALESLNERYRAAVRRAAKGRQTLTERQLGVSLEVALDQDPTAAAAVADVVLLAAGGTGWRASEASVRSEVAHMVGRRERRSDLVFVAGEEGLVVELKLSAPFGIGQLEDLARVKPGDLGLHGVGSLNKVVLSAYPNRVRRVRNANGVVWPAVQWREVYGALVVVPFADAEIGGAWTRVLELFWRRGKLGSTAVRRPSPVTVLEMAWPGIRSMLAERLGDDVKIDPRPAGKSVVTRDGEWAHIELRVRRGGLRAGWKLTIRLRRVAAHNEVQIASGAQHVEHRRCRVGAMTGSRDVLDALSALLDRRS